MYKLNISTIQCSLGSYVKAWSSVNLLSVSDVLFDILREVCRYLSSNFVVFSVLILPFVCFWTNALNT